MKVNTLFLLVFSLALLLSGCQSQNQVTHTESVSAAALSLDAETLLPSLTFQEAETIDGETVPIAWQAGYPLTSFDPQDRPRIDLAGTWLKDALMLTPL
jgi:hypothetical protein